MFVKIHIDEEMKLRYFTLDINTIDIITLVLVLIGSHEFSLHLCTYVSLGKLSRFETVSLSNTEFLEFETLDNHAAPFQVNV